MITFSIIFLVIILVLGIILSNKKKDLCIYCLQEKHNVKNIADQINLCPEHYRLFQNSNIKPFFSVQCSNLKDSDGVFMYQLYKEIKKNNIYCHIVSEYGVRNDEVETKQTIFIDYTSETLRFINKTIPLL